MIRTSQGVTKIFLSNNMDFETLEIPEEIMIQFEGKNKQNENSNN